MVATSALEPPSVLEPPSALQSPLLVPRFVPLLEHLMVSKWVREWRLLAAALVLDSAKALVQEL
jgi:hypothetical protein